MKTEEKRTLTPAEAYIGKLIRNLQSFPRIL